MDLVYIGAIATLFLLSWGLLRLCETLKERT
jgi:NADH:ubiquinone oxidoreductase subunit 6 (subunit J)